MDTAPQLRRHRRLKNLLRNKARFLKRHGSCYALESQLSPSGPVQIKLVPVKRADRYFSGA